MIGIVDYGVGNVKSFANIYKRLNIPFVLAKTAEDLNRSTHIILPGVGSFDWAMRQLNNSGLRQTLDVLANEQKKPILGVCVGMQMMSIESEEGLDKGLGWIDARVRHANKIYSSDLLLPHMGWNNVIPSHTNNLFKGHVGEVLFYFLHSYFFVPNDPSLALGITDYGTKFVSAVQKNNLFGVQFHPEKSHKFGIMLLKNFAEI
jgi:glutamine amidotransferase